MNEQRERQEVSRRLVARAKSLAMELFQLEQDAAHWNRLHPAEMPIEWDPEGKLVQLRGACQEIIDRLETRPVNELFGKLGLVGDDGEVGA